MASIMSALAPYIETEVPEAGIGYGVQVPQDAAYPCWSYQVIDDDELMSHGGGTGFYKARVQISLTAKETASASAYKNAAEIATKIRQKLTGFKGLMNGTQIEYCKAMPSDDWADQKQLPTVDIDIRINYIS